MCLQCVQDGPQKRRKIINKERRKFLFQNFPVDRFIVTELLKKYCQVNLKRERIHRNHA
jgi:hypothetical protein